MAKGFKTGGRKKGTPNKAEDIRRAFFSVFDQLGSEGLLEFAQNERVAFYKIIASLLPKDIEANVDGSITLKIVRYGDGSDDTAQLPA